MRAFFLQPFMDLVSSLERVMLGERRAAAILLLAVSLVVTWFVYVPVHELLHVLGCVITGGTVSELQVAPQYGGAILARMFPFVVSGGQYAGRLSGFDWKGSDLIYLATDFMPFVLTILVGVPLMKACVRQRRPLLFGTALVVSFAPIYSIPGDYYEMGSIITTRTIITVSPVEDASAYLALRSDDVFKLLGEIVSPAGEEQVEASLTVPGAFGVVFVSVLVSVLLALATYALGGWFARVIRGRRPAPTPPGSSQACFL